MQKLIITAAICGAELSREDTPYLPLTAKELADEALRAEKAGASIIHLHVRDSYGKSTQKAGFFKKAIEAMTDRGVTAIIQPSTGGHAGMSWEDRKEPLSLNPEMATLDSGTTNFGEEIFVNDLPMMRKFASEMKERGIVPELECFDAGNIFNALNLSAEGLLPDHLHFNLVLGVSGALPASFKNLLFLTELLPPKATWTASGIGRWQLPVAVQTLTMGGHVRVGLEDNIFYSKGVLAKGSAELVQRIVRISEEIGREIATPEETREILHLNKGRITA